MKGTWVEPRFSWKELKDRKYKIHPRCTSLLEVAWHVSRIQDVSVEFPHNLLFYWERTNWAIRRYAPSKSMFWESRAIALAPSMFFPKKDESSFLALLHEIVYTKWLRLLPIPVKKGPRERSWDETCAFNDNILPEPHFIEEYAHQIRTFCICSHFTIKNK